MAFKTILVSAGLLALMLSLGGAAWVIVGHGAESAQVMAGRDLYSVHCASCHGADLQGQPDWQTRLPNGRLPAPPHDASGHTWHHSDDQLFTIIQKGVSAIVPGYESDMPAFEGVLTDDQIRAILDFIKSTWPERERKFQAQRSQPRG